MLNSLRMPQTLLVPTLGGEAFTQGTGKVSSKVSSYVFRVRGIPAKVFSLVSWLQIMTDN